MSVNPHAATRRSLLLGSGALFAWAFAPKMARAEGRDPRFLTIVLRGALDGLAAVAPVGDPDWVKLRGDSAMGLNGPTPALPLDSFFALNPAMPNLHRMYQAKQAIVVHAVATPYRDRSHFDGQDVLESGFTRPGRAESGWLNRALCTLEQGDRVRLNGNGGHSLEAGQEFAAPSQRRPLAPPDVDFGTPGAERTLVREHRSAQNPRRMAGAVELLPSLFAVGPITPLVARGAAPVLSWVPARLPPVADDTTVRLLELYRHTDPTLARVLEDRIDLATVMPHAPADGAPSDKPAVPLGGIEQVRSYFAESAGAAGKFLASPDGPRIGALALDGWDTHYNEGVVNGRLSRLLGALDGALAAIETSMGAAWNETVVSVITEFGRTARINGTDGTDHGTATVAFLVGGALRGGRVIADWPGLKDSNLFENRDLLPTTDLRAVLKGLLRDHLRVDERALAANIFPGSEDVRPMAGCVA